MPRKALEMPRKTDAPKVRAGELVLVTHWLRVEQNTYGSNGYKIVGTDIDLDIQGFAVNGTPLVESLYTAGVYEKIEKVTHTELAEKFVEECRNIPFTVCFVKQNGEERVLRGRYIKQERLMGRSMVEDLDITASHKQRLVCHRELRWLIVNGVKYELKGKK